VVFNYETFGANVPVGFTVIVERSDEPDVEIYL
jgi:hypothetical protein